MTLALVTAPAGVTRQPSGLIVVRCEDYVGPARGTLSTVSDSLSVAGTVVLEEQALIVATDNTEASLSDRWANADDTLRVTAADIAPFISGTPSIRVWVGLKVLGDVPLNASKGRTWGGYTDAGASAGIAIGVDTTLVGSINPHGSVFGDQYKVAGPAFIGWSTINAGTDLVVRAWGITGGDIEMYLDALYLWPDEANGLSEDFTFEYFPTDFPPFAVGTNGSISPDEDQDDTDNILGEQSVTVYSEFNAVRQTADGAGDMQDNNDEPTVYDANGFGWFDGTNGTPADPKSRLVIIGGSVYIPDAQIVDDDFTSTSSPVAPGSHILDGPQGYLKFCDQGNFGPTHPSGYEGWRQTGGELHCEYGANQGGGPTLFPHADWCIGIYDIDFFPTDPLDPRNYHPVLDGLEDSTQEFTVNFIGDDVVLFACLGQFNTGSPGLNNEPAYGVYLDLTGGSLDVSLAAKADDVSFSVSVPAYQFAGPSNITGAYGGEVYRVKYEKRRYRMRVKVWLDGTGEPGSWLFDEAMPIGYRASGDPGGSIRGWVDYSYLTNWPTDVLHDSAVLEPWANPSLGMWPCLQVFPTSPTNPDTTVVIHDYTLDIHPEGSSPDDVHLEEEKYDFSEQWGSVTIPWGSQRFIESDLRQRHFGGDTNGFNLLAWKEASAPEMQAAIVLWILERATDKSFLPQIYRLVIF